MWENGRTKEMAVTKICNKQHPPTHVYCVWPRGKCLPVCLYSWALGSAAGSTEICTLYACTAERLYCTLYRCTPQSCSPECVQSYTLGNGYVNLRWEFVIGFHTFLIGAEHATNYTVDWPMFWQVLEGHIGPLCPEDTDGEETRVLWSKDNTKSQSWRRNTVKNIV